jgi:carboxyl-terminal processing protease
MEPNRRLYFFLPVAFAIFLVAGLLIGYFLFRSSQIAQMGMPILKQKSKTINELIGFIRENYVDSVDAEKLNDEAITGMLLSLDPHSVYIPASEFHDANDQLMGNFEGIGIQFRIEHDTVMVINTIPGGPSEKVGLLAGDRIVKVDGKPITGKSIDNLKVMKLLKGPRDTKVKVSIFRRGIRTLNDFTITRGVIPTWSIDISYAVNAVTGYVKLSKFSATTASELREALEKLKSEGVSRLILDLRGNSGGYLQEAIAVADEFLPEGKMIVYTKGLHRPKQIAKATSRGLWDNLPLTILIDEGSASASEIVAGAIQDNDRGTIIGRRSFGKGLVQEQISLSDGSALRLTVARYYTPTGRSIQKPYSKGAEDYYMEYYHRMEDGELESADSIKLNDSLKYVTPGGKTVYGGGGIMPDIFIPVERATGLKFYNESVNKGILYQFAFEYTDKNRAQLKQYADAVAFINRFSVSPAMFSEFVSYAEKNGIKYPSADISASRNHVSNLLKSYIARNLFDAKGFYPIFLPTDNGFKKAVEVLATQK